jgi:hypothetical protein
MNLQFIIAMIFYFKMSFILNDCLDLDCYLLIIPGNFIDFHLFHFEAAIDLAKSFLKFHLIFENLTSYKSVVISSTNFSFAITN